MCAKILLFFTLLFLYSCAVIEKSAANEPSVELQIVADVRRMETEIAHLFGYAKWPFAPTEVKYGANCRVAASYSYGDTIQLSCDTLKYRQGKPFQKKNVFGETETFPGYVEYLDTITHEIAHIFFRSFIDPKDPPWKKCDIDEYYELSEGFATYVAYEILFRESRKTNDPEYERYLAARTARYLIQLNVSDKRLDRSSSDFPFTKAFSPESKRYIDSALARFSEKKSLVLKDEDAFVDLYYPAGLVRVYALKHIFTKKGFEGGIIKKYFCR